MVGRVRMITIEIVGKIGLQLSMKVVPGRLAQVLNVGYEIMKKAKD